MSDLSYFFAAYCIGWVISHSILVFKKLSEVTT